MPLKLLKMNRLIKDCSLAVCMALMLGACQDFREEYHAPVEIYFSPAVSPATRSSYGLYPEDDSFGVWGFALPHDKSWNTNAVNSTVVMNGEKVSLYEDGWRTEEHRIWDHKSKTTFIAWAPYNQEVTYNHDKGICISSFDVLSDAPAPMFSYPVIDQSEPSLGKSVGITFQHALAFVEIRAASEVLEGRVIIIKSASINGLMSSGEFQSSPEPYWIPGGTTTEFSFCKSDIELNFNSISLGEARRMIPQTADIAVDLVIDVYDRDGNLIESGRSVRTNSLHVVWNVGRMYVYTVKLSETEATLGVEMLDL